MDHRLHWQLQHGYVAGLHGSSGDAGHRQCLRIRSNGHHRAAECRFPPGTPLAFEVRTSLRPLRLDFLGPVEYHDDVETIYVTEHPIVVPGLLPGDRPARMFCTLQSAAGRQVTIGSIPDHWQLPASRR